MWQLELENRPTSETLLPADGAAACHPHIRAHTP